MKKMMKTGKAGSGKPHIRMRKTKSTPSSAFPAGPGAFPPMPPQGVDPATAMGGAPGGAPGGVPGAPGGGGASPGDMAG